MLQALSTYKLSEEQAADPELDVLTGVLPAVAADMLISSSCSCALTGCLAPQQVSAVAVSLLASSSCSCALGGCLAPDGAPVLAACRPAGQLSIKLCPGRLHLTAPDSTHELLPTTGFQLVDGQERMIVVEGLADKGMRVMAQLATKLLQDKASRAQAAQPVAERYGRRRVLLNQAARSVQY